MYELVQVLERDHTKNYLMLKVSGIQSKYIYKVTKSEFLNLYLNVSERTRYLDFHKRTFCEMEIPQEFP